ncbi:MAG: TraR/DksA C4-type zinc finger protein [Candidatus Neomarinimicrobiota bacterium]|nr:TraR/DksA C4-type zinc finger protein [Candidatus Neomarinimicrobiota bacterium]|tara:strand:- start:449 stop:826 length:378 start_codon:yes stop_codon:yes gene_type:complete
MDDSRKKWSEKELQDFKDLIITKRNKMMSELEEAKKRADDARNNSTNAIYSSHMADGSADQQEMEKNYYWMDREKKFIQYLNRALDMIDDGSFGICTICGELISKERLEEVPHTSNCFKCKSASS